MFSNSSMSYRRFIFIYLCLEQNSGVLIISYIPQCLHAIGTAGTAYDLWEMVRTTTIKLMTTDA